MKTIVSAVIICLLAISAVLAASVSSNLTVTITSTTGITFTSVSMSGLTFTSGTASTVGTATATLSSGTPSPTWSLKTSGNDSASGAQCNNYSAYFAVVNLSSAPSGPSLTTASGTWTWGGLVGSASPGNYNLLLNGTAVGFAIAMEVYNANLYAMDASSTWYVYNSGTGFFDVTGAPPGVGAVWANASAPAQSYPGTCVQATQAGISNSPYSKAFTLVGSAATIPGPAAAAGFNQLIIDYDFTQTNPWSNRNNWLRCHNGSGASSPLLYQDWAGFGSNPMPSCSNISQATDPFGSLALHIINTRADLDAFGCDPHCDAGQIYWATVQTTDSSGNGNRLPTNLYVEVTGLTRSSDPAMVYLFSDFWTYSHTSNIEWDGIEWFGNNIGFTSVHNNESGNFVQTNQFDSLDQSAYHKYAWRVTSNGVDDGYVCSYKDDAPAASSPGNCVSWRPTPSQAANDNGGTFQFELGFAGCGQDSPGTSNGISCPNSWVEQWVRRLRVYSCAGINSGATCHSSSANP